MKTLIFAHCTHTHTHIYISMLVLLLAVSMTILASAGVARFNTRKSNKNLNTSACMYIIQVYIYIDVCVLTVDERIMSQQFICKAFNFSTLFSTYNFLFILFRFFACHFPCFSTQHFFQ